MYEREKEKKEKKREREKKKERRKEVSFIYPGFRLFYWPTNSFVRSLFGAQLEQQKAAAGHV